MKSPANIGRMLVLKYTLIGTVIYPILWGVLVGLFYLFMQDWPMNIGGTPIPDFWNAERLILSAVLLLALIVIGGGWIGKEFAQHKRLAILLSMLALTLVFAVILFGLGRSHLMVAALYISLPLGTFMGRELQRKTA